MFGQEDFSSKQEPDDIRAAFDAFAPLIRELVSDASSISQELQASEPANLLTLLTEVTDELLELVEVLADRPLDRHQLTLLGRIEATAHNARVQAQDFCQTFPEFQPIEDDL